MNKIDSQIDELMALIETMEKHQEEKEAQRKAEQIDAIRLADLERQSNV